ncbi:MAG: hypothetical protein AAGB12_01950 [Pseudomonadota bacterium]
MIQLVARPVNTDTTESTPTHHWRAKLAQELHQNDTLLDLSEQEQILFEQHQQLLKIVGAARSVV